MTTSRFAPKGDAPVNPNPNPYTFRQYPSVRVELPADGKVTGSVVISYVGQGHKVIVGTEGAHVNDNNPAIYYGGHRYIGRVWPVPNDGNDGPWIVDPDNSWNKTSPWSDASGKYTLTENWSDAGKLATRMIDAALLKLVADHFDATLAAEAEAVSAERDAMNAWKANEEAKAKAAEARKELRQAEAYLKTARAKADAAK